MMENEPQVGNREILSVLKEHHAWHQEPKKCIDEGSGVVWCLADAYSDSKLCDDTMAAIKTAREALTIASKAQWQPIETCRYDEIVLFRTKCGNVVQDFMYDCEPKDMPYKYWKPLPEPPKEPSE